MPDKASVVSSTATAGLRILVVDDEADIRDSLEYLLLQEGYVVETAPDATEGLRKIESGRYDLVLLDLMMPDRSGLDVLRDVRRKDRETPSVL